MENIKAIFGIFRSNPEVSHALMRIENAGIDATGVIVVQADHLMVEDATDELQTDILQGALIGALSGAGCGLAIGFFIDKLPLMEALTNSVGALAFLCTLLGLLLGASSGALIGIGTPEPLCKRYGRYLSEGDVLVAVPASNPALAERITQILSESGGFEVAQAERADTLRRISRFFVNPAFFAWSRINGTFTFSQGSALKMLRHQLGS